MAQVPVSFERPSAAREHQLAADKARQVGRQINGNSRVQVFAIVTLAGLSALSVSACGSNSGDNAGTGGGGIIIPGSGGSTGSGAGKGYDGGEVPITTQQIQAVKSQSCAGESLSTEAVPSVLELVIDVSSSMNSQAPGTQQTKWEVTRTALLEAIVGVNGSGLPPSVGVGALFYPNREVTVSTTAQDLTACVNTSAAIAPALLGTATGAQRTLLRNTLQQVQLARSTPTNDAYKYAFEKGITPSKLTGKKYMLLITDGTPTLSLGCMNPTGDLSDVNPQPIVDEIKRSAAAGIKTFLIGSPGSEANRSWMSQAAVIGGTDTPGCSASGPKYCHMDMTTAPDFSQALRDGLKQIVGQVNSCTYNIATPPKGQTINSSNISVILTSGGESTLVVRDDNGDCSKGWQFSNEQVHLCADTCSRVQGNPDVTVDVLFGCQSLTEPPIIK